MTTPLTNKERIEVLEAALRDAHFAASEEATQIEQRLAEIQQEAQRLQMRRQQVQTEYGLKESRLKGQIDLLRELDGQGESETK